MEEKIVSIDSFNTAVSIKVAIGLVNGELILWTSSITNGNSINRPETIDTKILLKHTDEVTDVSFSKDGTKIASCGLDRYLYVCDVDTGMILFKNEHPNPLICLYWCYANDILYLGDKAGFIYVWNMLSGEKKCNELTFNGPITSITSICRSADVDAKCDVIVAGVDGNEYLVKAWRNE